MGFREDFVWGAAAASYQVEGGAYEDGKGLSVWDVFCKWPGKVALGHNGDVACDHYHLMKEDVQLMKQLGLKAYRLSISWPRVMPEGTGALNPKGLDFYRALFTELRENGIEPYVTLFHWDYPYELYKRGGWLNPDSPKWFADYAAAMVRELGGLARNYFTFNEPQCFIGLGYGSGVHAPGLQLPNRDTLQMAHNVMLAHGLGVQAMRAAAPQPLQIGYAPTGSFAYPENPDRPEDVEAARRVTFGIPDKERWYWNVSGWSDPVLLGRYPEGFLEMFGEDAPKVGPNDLKVMHQKLDFLGQNIYNGACFRAGAEGRPEYVERPVGAPRTALNWPVTPECLYWGPRMLCERYGLPLYITENGLSCHDWVSLDGEVHDPQRIDFLTRYLRELRRCAADGFDIRGYFQWSVMDNFEWHSGYTERFGLVYVDYETQNRIIKDSGFWYKLQIASNGENL